MHVDGRLLDTVVYTQKDAISKDNVQHSKLGIVYDNLLYGPWDLSIVWDDAVCPTLVCMKSSL